jgi:Ca2+-binding EF-hand superfamily protein
MNSVQNVAIILLAFSFGTNGFAEELTVDLVRVPATADDGMNTTIASLNRPEDLATAQLSAYHADANGQWSQPRLQSTDDPAIRFVPLMLRTPTVCVQLDLSVLINGLDLEQTQLAFIQSVLKNAAKRNPADTASSQSHPLTKDVTASEVPTNESAPDELSETNPTVTASVYSRGPIAAKLERLVATTDADAEELTWMLKQWRPGPLWLIARDAVMPPRRVTEPLVCFLDKNQNGILESNELDHDPSRWNSIDRDRNQVIEETEFVSAARKLRSHSQFQAPRWQWNLAWTNMEATHQPIASDSATAELAMAIKIGDAGNKLSLRSDDFELRTVGNHQLVAQHLPSGLAVRCVAYFDDQLSEVASTQISIAARCTPTPMWNLLDQNRDDRLTELELRAIGKRFSQLDRNDDKKITDDEWPTEIELVICQGNAAQRILQSERPAIGLDKPQKQVTAPEWFTGMDVNNDQALSPKEFLGTIEKFNQYDQNNDGLVTAAEIASATESP